MRKLLSKLAVGRVKINGRVAELGTEVGGEDEVFVNGNKVTIKKNEYYLLNKGNSNMNFCICLVCFNNMRFTFFCNVTVYFYSASYRIQSGKRKQSDNQKK